MCHSRGVITSPLLPETIKHTSLQEKWPLLGACFAKGCLAYKSIAVILSIHKHTSVLMHAHTQCLMCTRQHLTNGEEEEEQPSTRRRRNIYYCCYELLCKRQRRTIYTHTSSEKNQLTKKILSVCLLQCRCIMCRH